MANLVYASVNWDSGATLSWLDASGISHSRIVKMDLHCTSSYSGHVFMAYGRLYIFAKQIGWNSAHMRIIRLPDGILGDIAIRDNLVHDYSIRSYLMDDGSYTIVYLYRYCSYSHHISHTIVFRLAEDDTTTEICDNYVHKPHNAKGPSYNACIYDVGRWKLIEQTDGFVREDVIAVNPIVGVEICCIDVRGDMLLFAEPSDSPVNLHVYDMSRGICTRIGDVLQNMLMASGVFLSANVVAICYKSPDGSAVWHVLNIADGSTYLVYQ